MKFLKKSLQFVFFVILFFSPLLWRGAGGEVFAQNNNIGIGTLTPDPSALLDIDASSTNNKGILIPRMTALQRIAIPSPANSLLVFDTDSACFFYYTTVSSGWKSLCSIASEGTGIVGSTGNTGSFGMTGTTGFVGLTGATGMGIIGTTGGTGITGLIGNTGSIGATGTGVTGNTGNTGFIGATGTGIVGTTGGTGLIGLTGNTGYTGATGAGIVGATGPTGDSGSNEWLLVGNSGTTTSTAAIGSTANNNFIGTTDAKDFVVATNSLERLRITSSGNIGIGISSPSALMEIKGIGNSIFRLQPNLPTEDNVITFGAASNTQNRSKIYASGSLGDIDGDLRFAVGLAATPIDPAMIITSLGNVGIGTSSPGGKLDVIGDAFARRFITTGNYTYNITDPLASDIIIGSVANGGIRHDASIMFWNLNSASRILCSSDTFLFSRWWNDGITEANVGISAVMGESSYFNGNLGIGTVNPSAKLEVQGNVKIADGSQGAGKVLTSDANGLASWQSLTPASAQATDATALSTTSTAWIDMTSMSVTLTTSGGNLLLSFTTQATNTIAGDFVAFRFAIDGVPVTSALYGNATTQHPPEASFQQNVSATWLATGVSAGSHTITIQWRVSAGMGVAPEGGEESDRTLVVIEIK